MNFFEFLNESVTPFHTANALKNRFVSVGFEKLGETDTWNLECGKSYFICRGSAVFAFRIPGTFNAESRFKLALAHTDFPALKLTPNPCKKCAGITTLHPEIYGSPLFNTWLDRDLGYAGILAVEKKGRVAMKLVRGGSLCRIPELAVHLNRSVNADGLKLNPQEHLDACFAEASSPDFTEELKKGLAPDETLLDFDLQLFDTQKAAFGGANQEWIYSGRLDNLSSCDALVNGLVAADESACDICGACFFDSEEVGSKTRDGAAGNFLKASLERVFALLGGDSFLLNGALADSLLLSVDMAHAEHPSYLEKSEPNHAPLLGRGIVLKTNAQKRYASESLANAKLKLICNKVNVPVQTFVCRNDISCGSTVGPAVSAALGIPTVDIGEPMLSMHSIREMTAVADHEMMNKVITAFFSG